MMTEEKDNPYFLFRQRFGGRYVLRQLGAPLKRREILLRIGPAPLICLAGGYFLEVYHYPLLFALAIAVANFQSSLGVSNFVLFLPNLIWSYLVYAIGVFSLAVVDLVLQFILHSTKDLEIALYSVVVFTGTPLLLLRGYPYLFNYRMTRVNWRRIAVFLGINNAVFWVASLIPKAIDQTCEFDCMTQIPFYFWLVGCCLTLQLLVYSRHLEGANS